MTAIILNKNYCTYKAFHEFTQSFIFDFCNNFIPKLKIFYPKWLSTDKFVDKYYYKIFCNLISGDLILFMFICIFGVILCVFYFKWILWHLIA